MKKMLFALAVFSTMFIGCKNNATEKNPDAHVTAPPPPPPPPPAVVIDTLCFEFKLKKDVTSCQLFIEGDKVTGYYDWAPHEKDGGHGILKNGVKKGDMITVDWKMMIEGSIQTEELVFKLAADKLSKMEGELTEKGDKLVMKSPQTAKVGEVMTKVSCSQIAHGIENAKSAVEMINKAK